MIAFIVKDSVGHIIRQFQTERQALEFVTNMGRTDWRICRREPTDRQIAALHYCEDVLNIRFKKDIHDINQVSDFLSKYLDLAKEVDKEDEEDWFMSELEENDPISDLFWDD